MKRHLIATLAFGLMLMTANGANAGPFEDGLAASDRQDYATALRLWKPLAEQGNAQAQFNLGVINYVGLGGVEDEKEAAGKPALELTEEASSEEEPDTSDLLDNSVLS